MTLIVGQPDVDQPHARYEIILSSDRGVRMMEVPAVVEFEYTDRINAPGWAWVDLPPSFDWTILRPDQRFEFWRYSHDEAFGRLAFVMFVRKFNPHRNADGTRIIRAAGPDPTELLTRRVNAYDTWAPQAIIAATPSDDAIKDIVTDNLGVTAGADRDLSDYGFSLYASTSRGSNVTRTVPWENVLDIVLDIARTGATEAERTLFHILPVTSRKLQFQTWIGQRHNRGWGEPNPLIFSEERGNLREPGLEFDYTDEVNYFYVLGPGEGATRAITEVSDDPAIGASAWNRREGVISATDEQSASARTALGQEALRTHKAKKIVYGTIVDTDVTRFQRDWFLGDRVAVEVEGRQENVLIEVANVHVTADGEDITSRFEVSMS